ncbi:hypothetical protein IG631_16537 [Alternaria alternata]|nr:hypothetical protein IG631_16537 [Alternaria alternata]
MSMVGDASMPTSRTMPRHQFYDASIISVSLIFHHATNLRRIIGVPHQHHRPEEWREEDISHALDTIPDDKREPDRM